MKLCHCFNNSTGKVLQSLFQVLFPNPQYIGRHIVCGRAQREAKQQICCFHPIQQSAATLAVSLRGVRNQPHLSKMQHTSLYYPCNHKQSNQPP